MLERVGGVPDFICVDGRFRVASVLESFMRLSDDAECQFMLDDFRGRGGMYGPVLQFAENIMVHDRAITFRRQSSFDREKCRSVLEKYYADPR
jgi:hypothetical protein